MTALRYTQFGPPPDVLRYAEIPLRPPGPREIRLRLTHRPISPTT